MSKYKGKSVIRHKENVKMWGYLPHMKIWIKIFVENILSLFANDAEVSISLVCYLKNDMDYCYLLSDVYKDQADFFNSVNGWHTPLSKMSMLNNYITGDFNSNEKIKKFIPINGYIEAIKRYCEKFNFRSDTDFQVLSPLETESYLIYCIIHIPAWIGDRYYKLKKDDTFFTYPSFYDACLSLMSEYIRSVRISDNTNWRHDIYIRDNIYQNAARSFLSNVTKFAMIDGSHDLFENITKISTLTYESKDIHGGIIVTKKNNFDIKNNIIFKEPIRMSNHKKIRKLLETLDYNNYLITDGALAYSIGELKDDYNRNNDDVFLFKMSSKFTWKLYCNDRLLLKYEYGHPYPEDFIFNYSELIELIDRLLTHGDKNDTSRVYNLIKETSKISHGTTLVFSRKIDLESNRLSSDGFLIEPKEIDYSYLTMITNIDGAVLIDHKCVCHSFGVILDGKSVASMADSSRGARYNSAIRYIEQFEKSEDKPLVVVISEDGMIDIFPKLPRKKYKSEITKKLSSQKF